MVLTRSEITELVNFHSEKNLQITLKFMMA